MRTVIGGTELYLAPDDLPEFSYSLTDLTDPSKVKGSTSTSFELPATNGTRIALGGPGLQEEATGDLPIRIGAEGQVLFEGTCRPVEWTDEVVTIEAYGDNATWIAEAKNTKANEVNLGNSGQVNNQMQEASWTDENRADVYPLIDYGRFYNFTATTNVVEDWLYPAVRVWKVLQAFFQPLGFTVKAEGSFTKLFKKLIVPYNGGAITFRGDYYQPQSARLTTTTDQTGNVLLFNTELMDASGMVSVVSGATRFTPVVTGTWDFRFNGSIIVTRGADAPQSSTTLFFRLQKLVGFSTWQNVQARSFPIPSQGAGTSSTFTFDGTLFTFQMEQGQSYRIRISTFADFGQDDTITLQSGSILEVLLTSWAGWQDQVDFDIAGSIDKGLTVADIISGITNIFRLVVRTDQATGEVVFQHLDDYLRGVEQGIDWRERLSHNEPPAKVKMELPSRYRFKYAEDTSDKRLRLWEEYYKVPLGEGVYEMGGNGDEKEVSVKFSATDEFNRFDGLIIPVIAKDDEGALGVDHLKTKPRILIFDGLVPGAWTFDGQSLTELPRAYFQGSGVPDTSMSFGGDWRKGTLLNYWRNSLERMKLPYLRGEFRVYDDEFNGFDFARPRLVNDGHGDVWMYVQSVKGKKFGDDDLVECELIPV